MQNLNCVRACMRSPRKNNRSEFIPDRQPDFPDEKFQKVTGDPFFVDESALVRTLDDVDDDVTFDQLEAHPSTMYNCYSMVTIHIWYLTWLALAGCKG